VEAAILGGVTVVQVREKEASALELYQISIEIKKITERYHIPLIINDRADIALAVNAAGVHIGQDDLPYSAARRIVGHDKIVGVSVSNLADALSLAKLGADYLGVGAMFKTGTKEDAMITSMEELARIRAEVPLPIVVIGGINKHTIPLFKGSGIDGIAVVSAIVSQNDAANAARELKSLFTGCEK
jgi:thiamine-phosphate pyrophosphorylase